MCGWTWTSCCQSRERAPAWGHYFTPAITDLYFASGALLLSPLADTFLLLLYTQTHTRKQPHSAWPLQQSGCISISVRHHAETKSDERRLVPRTRWIPFMLFQHLLRPVTSSCHTRPHHVGIVLAPFVGPVVVTTDDQTVRAHESHCSLCHMYVIVNIFSPRQILLTEIRSHWLLAAMGQYIVTRPPSHYVIVTICVFIS